MTDEELRRNRRVAAFIVFIYILGGLATGSWAYNHWDWSRDSQDDRPGESVLWGIFWPALFTGLIVKHIAIEAITITFYIDKTITEALTSKPDAVTCVDHVTGQTWKSDKNLGCLGPIPNP